MAKRGKSSGKMALSRLGYTPGICLGSSRLIAVLTPWRARGAFRPERAVSKEKWPTPAGSRVGVLRAASYHQRREATSRPEVEIPVGSP
jgi:hypothetical protein